MTAGDYLMGFPLDRSHKRKDYECCVIDEEVKAGHISRRRKITL